MVERVTVPDMMNAREARAQAQRKLVDVRERLNDLQRIEAVLSELVQRCDAVRGRVRCPLIAALQTE